MQLVILCPIRIKTMKIQISIIIIALFLSSLSNTSAAQNSNSAISLNSRENTLTAPLSKSYQWYRNNKILVHDTKKIKVDKPGKYTVVTSDENGNVKSTSITIGIKKNGEIYTIYIIGDSTVSDYHSVFYPQTGWGQVLPYFFDDSVIIENKALSGRSAKSFYNDHWQEIKDSLKPGDYVLIQFGINDAKSDDTNRYSEPFTTFKAYLTSFVDETKAKGAHPVLVSTVRRNSWNNTTPPTVYDAWHDYPVATRQLAGEINVPLIDLDQLSVPLYEGLGPDYVGPFIHLVLDPKEYSNYPDGKNDNVHFQEMGAIEMAKLVIGTIESYSEDTAINKLVPHIKPSHEISVSTNFPDGAIITRNNAFPEGLNITIKAKMDSTYDFLEWQDGSGTAVGTDEIYMFEMGNEALSFEAILDDDPSIDCLGEYNGKAYIDDCGDCVDGLTALMPCVNTFPKDTFKIISASFQKCLEDSSEFITQEECAHAASQAWILEKDNNSYRIKSLSSGKYLYSEKIKSGLYLSTDELSILWRIEEAGTDTFQLIPANTTDYAAEMREGNSTTGDRMRLYKRNGELSQKYLFSQFSPSDCATYPEWCATSINDISFENIEIQPNPFSNSTSLIFGNHQKPVSFTLFDLNGKEVFREENFTASELVFGSELKSGIYIGHIVSGSSVSNVKIIKR